MFIEPLMMFGVRVSWASKPEAFLKGRPVQTFDLKRWFGAQTCVKTKIGGNEENKKDEEEERNGYKSIEAVSEWAYNGLCVWCVRARRSVWLVWTMMVDLPIESERLAWNPRSESLLKRQCNGQAGSVLTAIVQTAHYKITYCRSM